MGYDGPNPLALNAGGTAVNSVTTSPTATAFAGWDANKNLSGNSFIGGYRTTATSAGTTTLVVGDAQQQYFTGSTTHNVVMPVTSTLVLGQSYTIINNSTGVVTVKSSGANTIQAMAASTIMTLTVINTAVTTAAGWNKEYSSNTISSSGITTLIGDSGNTTGTSITLKAGISTLNCGASVQFVNNLANSTLNVTDANGSTYLGLGCGVAGFGASNVGVGDGALGIISTGGNINTAVGVGAGSRITNTTENSCFGFLAAQNVNGSFNVSIGSRSLINALTSTNSISIGYNAASSYIGAESSNIIIGNVGTVGESNVVRIGTQGAGTGQQNQCFIAGITGVTVTGAAVLCSTTGALGTVASSERYKENITDMRNKSSRLLDLRPVAFSYKSDKTHAMQYGLIAEEVEKVMPELVMYDEEGKPETIFYHLMPAMLLNEIIKLRKEVDELKGKNEKFD